MGATLDSLRALQVLQTKLYTLRHIEESKRRDVQAKLRRVELCREKLGEFEQRRMDQQKRIDDADLDIKSREQNIDKLREDLNHSKTNREYATILTALNTYKADVTKLETLSLEYMAQIDELDAEKTECQAAHDKASRRATEVAQALEEYLASTAANRSQIQVDYEKASEQVTPDALQRFLRAAERHDGEGLAPVTQANPKRQDYFCGTCNMTVTLEQLNALMSRDEIQSCNGCGSILFLEAQDAV